MQTTLSTYSLYDLSNLHFQDVELVTKNGILKGQFVQFRVLKGEIEYLYPAEKYCFLPEKNREKFWDNYKKNKGEFKDFPSYVMQLGLNEIEKIIITPSLVA